MYKRILEGKKAVFFDMDGTIIDSGPLWERAFEKVLQTIDMDWMLDDGLPAGITITSIWNLLLEKNKDLITQQLSVKDLVDQTHTEFLKVVTSEEIDTRPGFWELLLYFKEQKSFKTAMTTNTNRDVTNQVASILGISSVFDLIITGDEVKKPKPDPEIYETAAKKLGVNPSEVLVFEDSVAGADAAANAKMDLIIIWQGKPVKLFYPETVKLFIPDFTSLVGTMDTYPEEDIQREIQQQSGQTPTEVA
jgi:HAD superfamily hydrolase (TIGR01509 family)